MIAALAAVTTQLAFALPPGFSESVVADGLDRPVAMVAAPDGRLFVCEQAGRVRIIRDGRLEPRPFVIVPTSAVREQGLLGIALDPQFALNGRLYLYYTSLAPRRHAVVARCVAGPDSVRAGSLAIVFSMDEDRAVIHAGGGLCFGADGRLYIGTGDDDQEVRSQSLRSTFGKVLRILPDGGIPSGNPFANIATGPYRAIWARGLRNAFAIACDPLTGLMLVHDVGASAWEEVNVLTRGGNYGWPMYEGAASDTTYRSPVHAYAHDHGCAITGGTFYRPKRAGFPHAWAGRYFFADYCAGEIRWIDPAHAHRSHVFGITRRPGPVALCVDAGGDLYYLVRGNADPTGGPLTHSGNVMRVSYSGGRAAPTPLPASGH